MFLQGLPQVLLPGVLWYQCKIGVEALVAPIYTYIYIYLEAYLKKSLVAQRVETLTCITGYKHFVNAPQKTYIYMERYNKSTMPVNADKYFYGPPGIRTHDLGNTA